MFFQKKCICVFLFIVINVQFSENTNLEGINRTTFLFNHPNSCKNNEFYNLDYFICLPCDSKENLEPSLNKLACDCKKNTTKVAIYDTSIHQPICSKPCQNKKNFKCPTLIPKTLPEASCLLKFINHTADQKASVKHIRIYAQSPLNPTDCSCDLKFNYLYNDDYCIWKPFLKNYLNHNAFWKRGKLYADLKFVAFFCQSLHNMNACNNLANMCVQSFFDTDKNSPCSVFLLAQASDASLYSSIGEKLDGLRPFLFYRKGKETVQEIEEPIDIPIGTYSNGSERKGSDTPQLELFSTVYSLEGHLVRWERLRPNNINICGHGSIEPYRYFQFFKNARIICELTLDSIIDMASLEANRYFFSIFLDHTREDNKRYLQTIPVLIENAFDGNKESNPSDWQLVKRFQIIGADSTFNSATKQMMPYEDSYKLRLFKSIRVLRKFKLRCTVTEDNQITVPLIVLDYHNIDISLNSSLSEKYKFELEVKFEKDDSLGMLSEIILSIFIIISLLFAVFRAYIFKCRRDLECFDMIVVIQALLNFTSNMGNSFLVFVVINVFVSVMTFIIRSDVVLLPMEKNQIFEFLIYSGIALKSFYFFVYFWTITRIDIFFVDWERPKSCDASLHLKNNLDTSSQCSSIRTLSENNVSAWRIFFLANEWIELSSKQKISPYVQGFVSLIVFWIAKRLFPPFSSNSATQIFSCVTMFSSVHLIQRIFRNFLLDQVAGSPLRKFLDICTLANVSIFTLLDCSFGYYIHGRSPHGFSDTDMSSMLLQLQRESQNMCGKRGLLSDSDFQTYIVLPPFNLRKHIEKLLPLKQKTENISQSHFQKDLGFASTNMDGVLDKSITVYNRVNRFFCAFIDHAIKDMDYIIKERTLVENFLSCEFESFVAENKGTFYIDDGLSFSTLFLYGNTNEIFVMELFILLSINLLTDSFTISIVIVCILNKKIFRLWVRANISTKTLIDKRFLI